MLINYLIKITLINGWNKNFAHYLRECLKVFLCFYIKLKGFGLENDEDKIDI